MSRLSVLLGLSVATLAACGGPLPAPAPSPDAEADTNTALEAATAALALHHEPAAGRHFEVRFEGALQGAAFVRGAFPLSGELEAGVRDLLSTAGPLAGGVDPHDDLILDAVREGDGGRLHLRFHQVHEGLPVEGGSVTVTVEQGVVTSIGLRLAPTAPLAPVALTPSQAEVAAAEVLAERDIARFNDALDRFSPPELIAFERAMWNPDAPSGLRPAWKLQTDLVTILIDAETGELLQLVDENHESAFTTRIQDHDVSGDLSGFLLYVSDPYLYADDCDSECLAAIQFNWRVYDHWASDHGRLSFDDADSEMWSLIDGGYANAYARQVTIDRQVLPYTQYGAGWVTYDIVAHEWNHILDRYVASNLTYQFQSGALDEALADLKGAYLERDWLLGEDIVGRSETNPIRDMAFPPNEGDPAHMDDYAICSSRTDNGCVHTNSGIINRAVFLMVDGGSQAGITVDGQGWRAIEPLLWDTQVNRLSSSSNFVDFRHHLVQSCIDSHGISDDVCVAVQDGLAAVGIGQAALNSRTNYTGMGGALAAGDLDGDGRGDLVLGVPLQDVDGASMAGAVYVLLGDGDALGEPSRSFTALRLGDDQDSESFLGEALALGDFDGDGDQDLAMGAPGEWISGRWDAGQACWLLNDGGGVDGEVGCLTQSGGTSPETNDEAGSALAAGDFDCDGSDDLAVGARAEDWGSITDTGAVTVHYSDGRYPGAGGAIALTQATAGARNEAGDRFGQTLAAGDFDGDGCDDLAVGVPWETNDFDTDAGQVVVFFGSSTGLGRDAQLVLPEDVGAAGEADLVFGAALAAGDFDGDGDDDLAVGAPGRTVDGASQAGQVFILDGDSTGLVAGDLLSSSPVNGRETGDRYGTALAAGNLDGDGADDLAVGAPMEDWGGTVDVGMVHVRRGGPRGLSSGEAVWAQDLGVTRVTRDYLGAGLAIGPFFSGRGGVAIGMPGADIDMGTDQGRVCMHPANGGDAPFCQR